MSHTRSHSLVHLAALAGAITCLALCAVPDEAEAGVLLGADLEVAIPVGEDLENAGVGFGVGGFLGYILPIPLIDLSVGAAGGYTYLSEGDAELALDVGQLMGQIRLAVDLIFLVPEVYGGVGYGWMSGENDITELDRSGLTWQIGAGLGLLNLPLLGLGIHVNYNELLYRDEEDLGLATVEGEADYQWVDVGLTAKISF